MQSAVTVGSTVAEVPLVGAAIKQDERMGDLKVIKKHRRTKEGKKRRIRLSKYRARCAARSGMAIDTPKNK